MGKNDLDKALARATQLGEARAKAVEERANENIAVTKKGLSSQIAVQVENMADNVFRLVQGNRQKIADNYLSLKAYAATAADKITDYLSKGKGRNLMSVGDLLQTVAALSTVKAHAAAGEGFGSPKIPLIFSGKNVKINGAVSKINGLVNEYIKTIGQVRARWPMGLGKYLVAKLETAMQSTGALEVDKVADKAGNYVCERPCCWSFLQAFRLRFPGCSHDRLRAYPGSPHWQAQHQKEGWQGPGDSTWVARQLNVCS